MFPFQTAPYLGKVMLYPAYRQAGN
jgi:hypothetical protein